MRFRQRKARHGWDARPLGRFQSRCRFKYGIGLNDIFYGRGADLFFHGYFRHAGRLPAAFHSKSRASAVAASKVWHGR